MGQETTPPLPPIPRTQALSSTTFKPPPLDGSLTLPEIYDWHSEKSRDHPLFVYPGPDTDGTLRTILWPEAVRAMHRAGQLVKYWLSSENRREGDVVAILANADTITFFTFIIGIMRAGFVVFPISTRNSASAISHLLSKNRVSLLLVGRENALQSLASDSLNSVSYKPTVSTMPSFEDIYCAPEPFIALPPYKPGLEKPAIILHSSGSTAFPKSIVWKHSYLLQVSLTPCFGERDLTGVRFACHSVPMFHAMGVLQTAWAASCGHILASFKPQIPTITPTPEAVMKGAIDTKSDIIYCVPSFVEHWSRDPNCVAHLQSIDGIVFGGGPLNKAVGDELSCKGVTLFVHYGSTECGAHSMILPRHVDKDWEFFYIPEHINATFVPEGNGNVEFVVASSPFLRPCMTNTKIGDVDAYAIGDLLTPHPSKRGFYRYYGRADDQIIHSTGEKTNPGPLENILNRCPLVQTAVIFGQGKFHAGVIVDPKPDFKFDSSNTDELTLFRQRIWQYVEQMNDYAPQHSRIFKEMIIPSKPSKPFTYTAKNTARRQTIINDYADEIEALYASVNESTQPDLVPPAVWDLHNVLSFVRKVTLNVMQRSTSDTDDIFQHGCDSLQATWIRNTLTNALIRSDVQLTDVPMNFVYENPTIGGLASYVSQLAGHCIDCQEAGSSTAARKEIEMKDMVLKYTANLPQHYPATDEVGEDDTHVVLLTGTTGGLGSVLLEKLLLCRDISLVYALNRKSSEVLRKRQESAFRERGIDVSILRSPKLILIECDLNMNQFGLEFDLFNKMRKTVTHIIHNAYTVNFNMALSTFENNISGLRNLIDFALASPRRQPPRLVFTSSVGVVRNCAKQQPVNEMLVDASLAVWSGYSESKWVCEQILANAASKTSLKPIIVRVDQLSGMSTNGFWNVKDWVPALFISSAYIGCIPDVDGVVSWVPIDIAAQAIVEMRDASFQVVHISHPTPTKWSAIARFASQLLSIPVVPFDVWFSNLDVESRPGSGVSVEDAVQSEAKNPALRLRDFFQSIAPSSDLHAQGDTGEALGSKRLSLENSLTISPTLENGCPPVSFSDVEKWLACLSLTSSTK